VRSEEGPQHPDVTMPTLDLEVGPHDPADDRAQLLVG